MYRLPESLVEHSSLEDHASSGPPEAHSPAAPIEQHGSVCRNIYRYSNNSLIVNL